MATRPPKRVYETGTAPTPDSLARRALAAHRAAPLPKLEQRPGYLTGLTAKPRPCTKKNICTVGSGEHQNLIASTGATVRPLSGSDLHALDVAVSYEEYVGSPSFEGNGQELAAESQWRVNWSDIENLYLILFPGAIGGIPQLPMLMPNSLVLRAESVSFSAEFDDALIVANDGNNHYSHARARIRWKTTPYSQANHSTDQIITRRITTSGEFLTLPGVGMRWADAPTEKVDHDTQPGIVIPIIEHHLTLHRVPSVPYAALRALVGCVNSVAFEGADAETVLFTGAELQQTTTSDGTQPWQVELHFQERVLRQDGAAVTWNDTFKTSGTNKGTWQRLETVDGEPVYPTADLNAIL